MVRSFDHLVYNWLRLLKIPISGQVIKEKLLSHPDYPSLLSITDTLDELGIENAALVVDKKKLPEIPLPFLAHTSASGGEFILVTDLKKLFKDHPDFKKKWNGVVVAAEKPEQFLISENEKWLTKEKRQKQSLWLVVMSIILVSTLLLMSQFSWQHLGLLITSLAGLGTAVLIVQHELGISNELTEQLCAAGKNTDCDAVMKPKGSKFLKWMNWADAGIIYFSSVFFVLTVSFFSGTIQSLTTILSLLATCTLLFTFFSIYYQWRIVKKWCPLCLATVALLWTQFLLLLPGLLQFSLKSILINEILFTVFAFAVANILWRELLKPALQTNKELTDKNFSLLRFRNNSDIFKVLLQQQRKADITPFENDLQLGNPEALLQIMVACNPYCGPCAKAHEALHELVERHDIGLIVRFNIKKENKEDKKLQAVEYILRLLNSKTNIYKRKVLHDWYAWMNIEKFSEKYPIQGSFDVNEQLKEQDMWIYESKIEFTPAIFINGHELPKAYNVNDLRGLIGGLIRKAGKPISKKTEKDLMPA